jgi:ubiquinone/menaquinone biosynthesis C-methylase UbiE
MDYDNTEIPVAYDRGRVRSPEVLALWMSAVSTHTNSRRIGTIVDLGCGTGRFSQALAKHFESSVIALDPSQKMLTQAIGKQHDRQIRFGRARAEALPLVNSSVDLIFISRTKAQHRRFYR